MGRGRPSGPGEGLRPHRRMLNLSPAARCASTSPHGRGEGSQLETWPMFSLSDAQRFMQAEGIDAWLLVDYRGSNPLLWHILGVVRNPTRRAFLIVPRSGSPVLLIHTVDQFFFHDVTIDKRIFRGWVEMRAMLRDLLGPAKTLALEYSEEGGVP